MEFEATCERALAKWKKYTEHVWRPDFHNFHDCSRIDSGCSPIRLLFAVDDKDEIRPLRPEEHEEDYGGKQGRPVFVCAQTARMHFCGQGCNAVATDNNEGEAICKITGVALGPQIRHLFWTPQNRPGKDDSWKWTYHSDYQRRLQASIEMHETAAITDSVASVVDEARQLNRVRGADPKSTCRAQFHLLVSVYFSREKAAADAAAARREIRALVSAVDSYVTLKRSRRMGIDMREVHDLRMHHVARSRARCAIHFTKEDAIALTRKYTTKLMALWHVLAHFGGLFESKKIRTNKSTFVVAAFEIFRDGVTTDDGQAVVTRDEFLSVYPSCAWVSEKLFTSNFTDKNVNTQIKRLKTEMQKTLISIISQRRVAPSQINIDGNWETIIIFFHLQTNRNDLRSAAIIILQVITRIDTNRC